MKKIFICLFLFSSFLTIAQDEEEAVVEITKRNEVKVNMTNLIAFKWVDITYEYVLNEEASIGVSTLFSIEDDHIAEFEEYRTFSFTPYYRQFFSSQPARGFFVEAFGMLHSGKDDTYIYPDFPPYDVVVTNGKYTDFAIGISVGGKFITKRGFIAEVYAGIGRDLLGQSNLEVVGRGGISIGFQF